MVVDPRWVAIEETLLDMRRLWFSGRSLSLDGGRLLQEADGSLISLIDATGTEADAIVTAACSRKAYVVITPFTDPPDMRDRLQRAGFHVIQQQGTYIFAGTGVPEPPGRRSLWSLFRSQEPVHIRTSSWEDLPIWNRTCRDAFGARGLTESESLLEKQQAYLAMGDRARWYLATVGERPVGTSILYRGDGVAQVLAVGTAPGMRRRGVASAMVIQSIRDWLQGSSGFLFLDTRPGSAAERLYRHLGFAPAYVRTIFAS